MNAEFFFHGISSAFQEWGTDRDSMIRYYANVSGITEPIRFSIELGRAGEKYCVYYSYLRYVNFFDCTGRSGSYFGLTIRLDEEYVRDVEAIYNLCHNVYSREIVGQIVAVNGESAHYLVSTFAEREGMLRGLSEQMAAQIGTMPSTPIAPTLLRGQGEAKTSLTAFNIMDAGSAYFWQQLRGAGQVLVSPYYTLRENQIQQLKAQIEPEKRLNSQLNSKNEELANSLSIAKSDNKKLQSAVAQLQGEKEALAQQSKELQKHVTELEQTVGSRKAGRSIEQSVTQIASPLEELLRHIRKIVPAASNSIKKKTTDVWEWLHRLLPILTLLLVAGLFFFVVRQSQVAYGGDNANVVKELKETVQRLQHSNQELMAENSRLKKKIGATNTATTNPSSQPVSSTPDYSALRIDIDKYSGSGPLKVGITYGFSIKGENYPKGGKWSILVNNGPKQFLDGSQYTIKDSDVGPLVVRYELDGRIVSERKIETIAE